MCSSRLINAMLALTSVCFVVYPCADEGTFVVSVPDDIGIKYLRLVSDTWLALGTMMPNVTGCYNSTIQNETVSTLSP